MEGVICHNLGEFIVSGDEAVEVGGGASAIALLGIVACSRCTYKIRNRNRNDYCHCDSS